MSDRPLVLIADDDPDILDLISFGLRRAGYDTVAATNGADALELAAEHRPDVAVLDVMMPRLDGCEVTRRLRAADATVSMPILLLTALADESAADRGLAAGADAYMRKPFSPRLLAERVEALLGAGNGRANR